MFPPGSGHGHTFAAPEIWTRREDFERLARSYDAATERLVEAARAKAVPELRAVRHGQAPMPRLSREVPDPGSRAATPGTVTGIGNPV